MSCENEGCQCRSKQSSNAMWITLIAAVGVSAAAYIIVKQMREKGAVRVDNIYDLCDRAVQTLDDRIGVNEALYAAS